MLVRRSSLWPVISRLLRRTIVLLRCRRTVIPRRRLRTVWLRAVVGGRRRRGRTVFRLRRRRAIIARWWLVCLGPIARSQLIRLGLIRLRTVVRRRKRRTIIARWWLICLRAITWSGLVRLRLVGLRTVVRRRKRRTIVVRWWLVCLRAISSRLVSWLRSSARLRISIWTRVRCRISRLIRLAPPIHRRCRRRWLSGRSLFHHRCSRRRRTHFLQLLRGNRLSGMLR